MEYIKKKLFPDIKISNRLGKTTKNLESEVEGLQVQKYSTFSEQFLEKSEAVGEYVLTMGGTFPWFIATWCTWRGIPTIDDVDTFD